MTKTQEKILNHEDKIFKQYSEITRKYVEAFAQYGCVLKIGQVWINTLSKTSSSNRLSFENGYCCYVYCNIEKNGEVIHYEDTNGEVDYYELSACWSVSSISRVFFQLKVNLYKDISDVTDEMEHLLKMLVSLCD
jgi:hypothetical protein